MIQLQVLTGSKAGAQWVARRFPVQIGRASGNSFQSEDAGVWDQHARIECRPRQGFELVSSEGAITLVNSAPSARTMLKNGDLIEMGGLKLRFWLSENRQSRMQVREWATWAGLLLVTLGQVALIYWLLRE